MTGCIFDLLYVRDTLIPELDSLKRRHFNMGDPDEPVILHREDIINHRGPFKVLQDDKRRVAFDDDLVKFFRKTDFVIITVVIDKGNHFAAYGDRAWNPYHYCLKIMLERYCGFLSYFKRTGDVMAESRGKGEDSQLKNEYRDFYQNGTSYISPEEVNRLLTSKEIKLKKKNANVAGLQVADLLAHPSKQDVLLENGIISNHETGDFCRRILPILDEKYNRNYATNRIKGYGKIFRQ